MQINATGDQREQIIIRKTYNFQFFNMVGNMKNRPDPDPGSPKVKKSRADSDPEHSLT
jgi:hypothetical protein